MKSFKNFISEVKKSVASWQAGVRFSQAPSSPSSEQFKDPDFSAGFKTGMKVGPKAGDPSYRANRVKREKRKLSSPTPPPTPPPAQTDPDDENGIFPDFDGHTGHRIV